MLRFLCTVFFLLGATSAFAQNGISHQPPTQAVAGESTRLEFVAGMVQEQMVEDAFLMYRLAGQAVYEQIFVRFEGNRFVADLSLDENTTESLEYFLTLELRDGTVLTYPSRFPEDNPVSVPVVSREEVAEDSPISGFSGEIQYNILSPEPGELLADNDVVVAITMFYAEGDALPETFRVIFNGRDVTASSNVSPFFISYVPRRVSSGPQRVTILTGSEDNVQEIASWSFEVITEAEMQLIEARRRNLPNARVELSARNQSFGGNDQSIYRASSRVSGTYGSSVRYSFNGMVTSLEDPRLQPQNRYAGEVRVGNWFELQAGHVYPRLSPLLLSGRRVYGINSRLGTPGGSFQVQGVVGQTNRPVPMLYTNISEEIVILGQTSQGVATDTTFVLGLQPGGMGTYQRDLYGGRISFGSGRNFQFGLSGLKVEDQISSIDVIRNYEDVPISILMSLNEEQRMRLEENTNQFRLASRAPRAEGNFVLGSDIAFNAHNNRIQFRADGAASVYNRDITDGVIDQQWADDFGIDLDEDIENILDRLQTIIIINENMSVLPVDISSGELDMDLLLSLTAAQARLGLNYFNHNFSIQYRFIGPNYMSLGNSALRKDVAGFTVTDRFRIINNSVFVSLSYENLNDNLANTRQSTTNTVNYRGSVSWFPVQRTLPRVTVSTRFQTRNNGIERFSNPELRDESGSLIDPRRALRNVNFAGETPLIKANPRDSETFQYSINLTQYFTFGGLNHEAFLGFSDITTTDKAFAYGNFDSRTYNAGISTGFVSIPLRTELALSYNSSVAQRGLNEISIYGVNTGATYLLLDNKLTLRADLAITFNDVSTTPLEIANADNGNLFDDYFRPNASARTNENTNTYIFRGNARYNITNNHALILDANFTNVVLLGAGTLPNDRLLQARYVFTF